MEEQEKEKNLPAVVTISEQQLKQKYDPSKYHMLIPFEGEVTLSPFIKMEEVKVRIDKNEIHNIHGKYQPNADATRRLLEAGSIDIISTETERTGDYIWMSTVWGRKRNPDGTWRPAHGSYEFDANVRAEELRLQMKGKSEIEIEKEVLKLKKFGSQRANTGATLRMIRAITGLPTSFENPKELEKSFVLYRFILNMEVLFADPVAREHFLKQLTDRHEKEKIYGPDKVESAEYQIENNGDQKKEETPVPYGEEPEQTEEEKEIEFNCAYLKVLSDIEFLHKKAKAEALKEVENKNLDSQNKTIKRVEDWLDDPKNIKLHGESEYYSGGKLNKKLLQEKAESLLKEASHASS